MISITMYLHLLKAVISESIQYYQGQVGDQTCNMAFLHKRVFLLWKKTKIYLLFFCIESFAYINKDY